MSGGSIVIVGDALLDRDLTGSSDRIAREGPSVIVDDPEEQVRPGGAGLAAVLAARAGADTVLVTALSGDRGGSRLRALLASAGVQIVDIGLAGATPEKVRIWSRGTLLLRVDRGSCRPAVVGPPGSEALAAIAGATTLLVSDYGGNIARSVEVRTAISARADATPVVWDPAAGGSEPVPGTLIATPNVAEAAELSGSPTGEDTAQLVAQGRRLAALWKLPGVAITRGAGGALLVASSGSVTTIPTTAVRGDSCGAGDSFAVTVAICLAGGATVEDAVGAGVAAATAFVAGGGVSALTRPLPAATEPRGNADSESSVSPVATRVRAAGGLVVATGGCFDLLHAGHLSVLSGARTLGDCLVVCLNSDASTASLKGPGRPLVPQTDRAAVLRALPWVDDVVVFPEATPDRLLRELRPDVWAKGGDYSVAELPEAATVASWGGQVVTLPYLPGCSTTRLLERAVRASE